MANSLRAKISKLRHDGNISNAEYQELIKKLDGHDKQIRAEAIDEFTDRIRALGATPLGSKVDIIDVLVIAKQLKEQTE